MALTMYDIRRIMRPSAINEVSDDIRIIDSWTEYGDDPNKAAGRQGLKYMCYEMETMNPETNERKHAYARILERLSAFGREYTIEYKLYGTSEGLGIDELIGDDDITVLESKGLESTFNNFIFGVVVSGFYKYALGHDGGFLAKNQYETVLVNIAPLPGTVPNNNEISDILKLGRAIRESRNLEKAFSA